MGVMVAIAVGGAGGALARAWFSVWAQGLWGGAFPAGILAVNIIGSFLMGLAAGLMTFGWPMSAEMRALVTTGFLGGFTTFSAFSLDAALLIQRDEWMAAALYVALSVLGSVGGLFAGMALMKWSFL